MKKVSIFKIAMFALVAFIFNACQSPQKLYENGNYDEAIELAVKRLRERKVKEKDVQTLLEAFNYINRKDAEKLSRLRAQRTPDTWTSIYDLANRISHRQELVKPLIKMDETKYYGKLTDLYFENGVNFILSEARDGAADFLYNKGVESLNRARNGERMAAREAYNDFNTMNAYYSNYKDSKQLIDEAYRMGINHVYFKMENQSLTFLPAAFENTLQSVFVRDLNSQWIKYHTYKDENLRYEYNIVAKITRIDVSPERYDRNHHFEEAQVEDGYDYVLDAKGNVQKDTLGNDVKVKRFKMVRAEVFEVRQYKEARVAGYLEYYDNRTRELVVSRPIESNANFNHYAVRFEGDRRALCENTRNLLGNSPVPFPSNEDMLLTVAENLKANAKRIVRDNDYVLAK
jgi:hypothetical protein